MTNICIYWSSPSKNPFSLDKNVKLFMFTCIDLGSYVF